MKVNNKASYWFAFYLKSRFGTLFLYVLIVLSFLTLIISHGFLPQELGYPLLLMGFFCMIYEAIQYYKAYKLIKIYMGILKFKNAIFINSGEDSLIEGFGGNSFESKIYGLIVRELVEIKNREVKRFIVKDMENIDYFSLWAHQIKTPLFGLSLAFKSGEEPDRDYILLQLSQIEDYVDMAIKYIEIDDFNRDLDLSPVSLGAVLKNSIKLFSRQFAYKKLELDFKNSDISVYSDAKWLEFAVSQLISNSVKYSKAHGVIKIYAEETAEYKRIVVADSGVGIPAEDMPRVFDKGFYGKNGRDMSKSTGIGLYVCKKVLEKLGHRIEIKSEYGAGTEVSIYFRQ